MSAPAPPAESEPAVARKPRLPRWVDAVFLLAGLALLAYVVSRYPLAEIGRACRRMGPFVLVTPLIALAWFCLNTTALHLLLDRRVPWLRLLRIRLIGDGYNALLPLAGFGGEPFKVKHLSAFVPVGQVLTALIRDRVLENAVGWLFSALCLGVALRTFALAASLRVALVLYAAIGVVVGVAVILLVLTSLPARLGGLLARWLGAGAPDEVRLPPARLARVACCYLGARLIGTLEATLLLWLLGLGFDPATILFCYGLHQAAGSLSFAIPAGWGVFEGTSAYLFSVLGFPGPAAVAFALARRGRMLVLGLAGVALHLLHLGSAAGRSARGGSATGPGSG